MYAGNSLAPQRGPSDASYDSQSASASPKPGAVIAVDLFAGAGGFSAGASAAGITVGGAIEFNEHAAATYRANIKRPDGSAVKVIDDDIRTQSPSEALALWELRPGECDLIIGGPPCQGFSTHRIKDGRRRGGGKTVRGGDTVSLDAMSVDQPTQLQVDDDRIAKRETSSAAFSSAKARGWLARTVDRRQVR